MHSVPKYPSIDTATGVINHLTPSSSQYGQSIVCLSLTSEAKARDLIAQVLTSKPFVYHNTFENLSIPNPEDNYLEVKKIEADETKDTKSLEKTLKNLKNLLKK